MAVHLIHENIRIAGTKIFYAVGSQYGGDYCVGIGINPFPPMWVTVVVEFAPTKDAEIGAEGNFRIVWMCHPSSIVSEVQVEEEAIVTPPKPRIVLPGETGAGT